MKPRWRPGPATGPALLGCLALTGCVAVAPERPLPSQDFLQGTCFNCHGKDGMGNGPAAVGLDHSPRNFHHHGLWRHRTEGEIFWVIKHGSPGTAMIGFGTQLTDEEIWAIVHYLRGFAGDRGPREGMGPRDRMGGRHRANEECCASPAP